MFVQEPKEPSGGGHRKKKQAQEWRVSVKHSAVQAAPAVFAVCAVLPEEPSAFLAQQVWALLLNYTVVFG